MQQEQNHIKYAGFGMRMLASTIDTILSTIVLIPFFSIFKNIYGSNEIQDMLATGTLKPEDLSHEQIIELITRQSISFSLQSILIAVAVIIFWIYRSATPGKMILKMKIVDAKTNGKPSRQQLIIRYLGYFIAFLPLALGFIWIYYDKKSQGWHDKIAGTAVIYTD